MSGAGILREALRGLAAHRLRAGLAAAGIVFGVAAVLAALAVAAGAKRRALDDVAALGVDNAYVRARPAAPGRAAAPRFAGDDVHAVERGLPRAIVAAARRQRARLEYGGIGIDAQLAGVTPRWREIAGLALEAGRWLSEDDLRARRRVIVLARDRAAALGGPAPGERVRWSGRWFTVVGIAAPARAAEGQAGAYVPLTAADARLTPDDDGRGAQEIAIRAPSGVEQAAATAARLLDERGHAASLDVVVPRALMRARMESQRTFDWVLFAIGAVALTISGIGIMNIMMASVAERTSEIGVRRASGARRRDVLAQFAAEAALLCLAGGTVGIPLGALFAGLIAAGARWPVEISISSVVLSLGLAVIVGLGFGTYPARRAARLDPVEALRG